MVHTITHELRTPLTAITGYAGLIRKEQCEDKSGQYIQNHTAILRPLAGYA
ncbi:hypothetical protein LA335_23175 [Bacteroides fragilis]|nr:hypothetical protein [Bacteroides fragilis]